MSSISGVGGFRPPPPKPPTFEKLDGNSDGALSLEEFKSSAPKGADASKSEALFKSIDSNSDGSISKDESDAFKAQAEKADTQLQSFLFGLQQTGQAKPADGATEADKKDDIFAQLDSNSDGSVAKDEFLSALSEDKSKSSDLLSKLFDAIDSDKDGSVSKEEQSSFRQAMERRGPPPPPPPQSSLSMAASQSYGVGSQLGASASATATYSKAA